MAQANITSPIARSSEAQIVIVDFAVRRDSASAYVIIEYQDAGANATRQARFDVPDPNFPSANLQGLLGAMLTTRATETGVNTRKMQFRVLGYLSDSGYLPGATVVA